MKIARFETFLANSGLRNYLFLRLTTDNGLTGIGEASLEWQEKTVETVCHEWVEDRILGRDPFDIEAVIGGMIRDQYQGGSTIMTAISGVEVALWDIIGKACQQPVYKLLGGRCHSRLPAYANGWYGGARTPQDFAERARDVVRRGYRALKFDPFGTAWKNLTPEESEAALDLVAAVREAVGPEVGLMIEFHGRLSAGCAVETMRKLEQFDPVWCEEPVAPESIDLLAEVKKQTTLPVAAGERLYTLADFYRLISLRAVDVVQMDISHCGGLWLSKKIAAMAAVQDIQVSPHCSVGPVALAACLHFDLSTPNFMVQEAFAEFDVPWRNSLVCSWNPIREGAFFLPEAPGLGLELDEKVISEHPYIGKPFPSLWDGDWFENFTRNKVEQ
jgi:galactonate dehydratase